MIIAVADTPKKDAYNNFFQEIDNQNLRANGKLIFRTYISFLRKELFLIPSLKPVHL